MTMLLTEKDLDFSFARTKREAFRDTFPNGAAELTIENVKRAARVGLGVRWLAEQLMDPEQLEAFNTAAHRLVGSYLRVTARTRQALKALEYPVVKDRPAWFAAHAAHEENKRRHWEWYLDGLAEVFIEMIGGKPSSTRSRKLPASG